MSLSGQTLRIRANASENTKGVISCEVTIELTRPFDHEPIGQNEDIAQRVKLQLIALHDNLRKSGFKLAVDGGFNHNNGHR